MSFFNNNSPNNNFNGPKYPFEPPEPWNIAEMSWSNHQNPAIPVPMMFQASSTNSSDINSPRPTVSSSFPHKRRSEFDCDLPTKKLLTEEKMAESLSNLHISSDTRPPSSTVWTGDGMEGHSMASYTFDNAQWDLEKKLRNAQKITVCDEVLNLEKSDSVIPEVLLNRLDKRCTALVPWVPGPWGQPSAITRFQKGEETTKELQTEEQNLEDEAATNEIEMDSV